MGVRSEEMDARSEAPGIGTRDGRVRGGAGTPSPASRSESGTALVIALFALLIAAMLTGSIWVLVSRGSDSTASREDGLRALQLAEAGAAHAKALVSGPLSGYSFTRLLRGDDNVPNTADDGILDGYGLSSAEAIPDTGRVLAGGRYFVQVVDDPADPNESQWQDGNDQVSIRSRGLTDRGAVAEIEVVIGLGGEGLDLPGIAAEDDMEISGKLKIQGECGGAHVNGKFHGGGEPSAETKWTATGSIPSKFQGTKEPDSEPMEVPTLEPTDYMGAACDYTHSGDWELKSSTPAGTHCVTGNVESDGDFGSWSNKRSISIIATGSIEIGSKPFIKAAHPKGILLMAGGDFSLQGDWGGEGLLYARGHCYVSSKPKIHGQLICKGLPNPPGAEEHTDKNLISGDAEITFDCSSMLNDGGGGGEGAIAWFQRIGTN